MPEGAGNIAWPSRTCNAQRKTPRSHEYKTNISKITTQNQTRRSTNLKQLTPWCSKEFLPGYLNGSRQRDHDGVEICGLAIDSRLEREAGE